MKSNFFPQNIFKVKKVILAVGVDISKDDFHVCIKEKSIEGKVSIKGSRKFKNDYSGFSELISWVKKREKEDSIVQYIMEATGCYYEDLAYFLHEKGNCVSVVLANKIKYFAKSLNVKTKTDKVDAAIIAEIGIERELQNWSPMTPEYKHLRDLCREMLSLKREKSRAKCQLHAMKYSHDKASSVIMIKENQISFYDDSINIIQSEIKKIIDANSDLKQRIGKIMKVKGLGMITIIVILCETNGFQMFNNIRQVVSYAGLDVVMKESGQYKGKTRISKKGNARIRQCLYMPALAATMYNEDIKNLYKRINDRNPEIKRKGIVAGMRKLLILTFVLWKKNEEYNLDYKWQK